MADRLGRVGRYGLAAHEPRPLLHQVLCGFGRQVGVAAYIGLSVAFPKLVLVGVEHHGFALLDIAVRGLPVLHVLRSNLVITAHVQADDARRADEHGWVHRFDGALLLQNVEGRVHMGSRVRAIAYGFQVVVGTAARYLRKVLYLRELQRRVGRHLAFYQVRYVDAFVIGQVYVRESRFVACGGLVGSGARASSKHSSREAAQNNGGKFLHVVPVSP